MSIRERFFLVFLAAAAVVLRVLAFFRYRFDSDEQQHLHVVWGWTAGLVQYRDVFDNHTPLFHLVTAPLLALLGERANILLWMRLPMLLLFGVVLWATWGIARRLFDARIAAWSVVLLALFPPFFLKSLEFRNDNLWTACWMLALFGLLRGWRPFAIGLLLGCALAASLKTTLLLATLVLAGALVMWLRGVRVRPMAIVEGAVGSAIVPGGLALYFLSAGAWDELVYCNFIFNGRVAVLRPELWIGRALFPVTFGAVVWLAWRNRAAAHDTWRFFFAIAIGVYVTVLAGFWVLISTRDFLAIMPLCAIFAAAWLQRRSLRVHAVVALLLLVSLWRYADRFENKTAWHITMMDQALRLSRPGEMLIDYKGETIYRRRPFYYALESVARMQLSRGIIADTIADDVVRNRTYVAQADGPLWPPQGRAFLNANFVNVGRLRAAGQFLKEDGTFTIVIPGEYLLVSAEGEVRGGLLDGAPYDNARQLQAGAHRYEGAKNVAVMWAPAFRRGHSPFQLRDTEF